MAGDYFGDIQAFVRAADARSFTVAAEQLGMSRSGVGKSVARLEARLGVRLLHRTTRAVTLTDEGSLFYQRCVPILADLEDAEAVMASRAEVPRGQLRLDLPVSFGRLHVMPVLQQYMERWPEVVINLSFTDRYIDLIDEGVDLVIRIGGAEDSRLKTRTLAQHRLVTCATRGYLAAHGCPTTPEQLGEHSCLAYTHAGRPTPWRFAAGGTEETIPVRGRLASTNAEALRDAARAGYGIAQLATFLIGDDLRAGRLVPVLAEFATLGEPIRAVYPSGRHLAPKVRQFIDLMAERWSPGPPWDRQIADAATAKNES